MSSEQTATERLRALLDERGVEWDVFEVSGTEYVHWTNDDGLWCAASVGELRELSKLHVNILNTTPEQAIAATLGNDGVERTNDGVAERGTCRMEYAAWDDGTRTWGCICSGCGKRFEYETGEGWNYCSNCGAEVEE